MRSRAPLLALLAALVVTTACETGEAPTSAPERTPATPAQAQGQAAQDDTTSGAAPAAGAPDIPSLVADVEPSVVAIIRPQGEGSGVIYDSAGLIVTNDHVVRDAPELEVQFADGTRVPAEVVASDRLTDLAVVRVERDGLPAATFADSLPQVGEFALALGNPLGFQNTATAGIVSGLHRSLPAGPRAQAALVDLLQTDAAISPGNSGGALVGAGGEVLGVNVAYAPPQAGAVSLGFAIPAPTVVDVVGQLLEDGEVRHAFLGIQPAPISPQVAQRFDLPVDEGVLVVSVERDTPAGRAGVESGMVITAFDGEPVRQVADLFAQLRRNDPGDEVTLTVVTDQGERTIDVTLGNRPQR